MRKRQLEKDSKVMYQDQQMFRNALSQIKDENLRLSVIHHQIAWCHRMMSNHHDDERVMAYCRNWLSVLNDALNSIA